MALVSLQAVPEHRSELQRRFKEVDLTEYKDKKVKGYRDGVTLGQVAATTKDFVTAIKSQDPITKYFHPRGSAACPKHHLFWTETRGLHKHLADFHEEVTGYPADDGTQVCVPTYTCNVTLPRPCPRRLTACVQAARQAFKEWADEKCLFELDCKAPDDNPGAPIGDYVLFQGRQDKPWWCNGQQAFKVPGSSPGGALLGPRSTLFCLLA